MKTIRVKPAEGMMVRHGRASGKFGQPVLEGDRVPASGYYLRRIQEGSLLRLDDTPKPQTKE